MFFPDKKASPVSEIPTSATAAEITQTGRDGAFVNHNQTSQATVSKFIPRYSVLCQPGMMKPYKRREEDRKKGKRKANHVTTLRMG